MYTIFFWREFQFLLSPTVIIAYRIYVKGVSLESVLSAQAYRPLIQKTRMNVRLVESVL